jgi:hypothetical protein
MCASGRDWQLGCYDSEGERGVCVIDLNHGGLRVGLAGGEQNQFFELRGKQVGKFRVALDEAIMAANGLSAESADSPRWTPPASHDGQVSFLL